MPDENGVITSAPPADTGAPPDVTPTPSVDPTAPASPSDAPQRETPRQLRDAYESLKAKYEPYEKLGNHEDLSRSQQAYQQLGENVQTLAQSLKVDPSDLDDAIKEHGLVKVFDYLKNQATAVPKVSPETTDPMKAMEQRLLQQVQPALDMAQQQQADRGYTAVENSVGQLAAEKLGIALKDIPPQVLGTLLDATGALMQQDAKALKNVLNGKTSDVKRYFDQAFSLLDGFHKEYTGYQQKRNLDDAGNPKAPPATKSAKGPSLDDIINGRESAITVIPSMR